MEIKDKDKQQLVDEVDALLRKVAELEDSVARHKQEREAYHTAFEYAKKCDSVDRHGKRHDRQLQQISGNAA